MEDKPLSWWGCGLQGRVICKEQQLRTDWLNKCRQKDHWADMMMSELLMNSLIKCSIDDSFSRNFIEKYKPTGTSPIGLWTIVWHYRRCHLGFAELEMTIVWSWWKSGYLWFWFWKIFHEPSVFCAEQTENDLSITGSHALKHTLVCHLFHSKWDQNLQNEHHAVWKKQWLRPYTHMETSK